MPPRTKKTTPKAAEVSAPPSVPKRVTRAARTKSNAPPKKPSPKVVVKQSADSDEIFRSNSGGHGGLKYDGSNTDDFHPSDLDEEEISPTPGPSGKRRIALKAEKIGGRRRVAPQPRKKKQMEVLVAARASRRQAARKVEDDDDIEIIEDGTLGKKDEGSEPADAAAADSDTEMVVKEEEQEQEQEQEGEEEGEEAGEEEEQEEEDEEEEEEEEEEQEKEEEEEEAGGDAMEVDTSGEESGDDEPNGNTVIDDAADESGEEEMDVDEDEEDGDDQEAQASPSPKPVKAPSRKGNKRRIGTALNLSDAEDMPVARKRRTTEPAPAPKKSVVSKKAAAPKKTLSTKEPAAKPRSTVQPTPGPTKASAPKTIKAVGHSSEITLTMRASKKDIDESEPVKEKKVVKRKPKVSHKTSNGTQDAAEATADVPEKVKNTGEVAAKLTFKSKGKKKADEPKEDPKKVDPQDAGCEVTHEDKQCSTLLGTYDGLVPLKNYTIDTTHEVQLANLDVVLDAEQFRNYCLSRIQWLATTQEIPTAFTYLASRVDPKNLVTKASGSSFVICPRGAASGEAANLVWIGFAISSALVSGRTYKTPLGLHRQLKELHILPIQQECERAFAVVSAVFGGKINNLVVTEDGALTFATKHTAVDEDGNPESKGNSLAGKFLAKTNKALPRSVLHEDIQRRAHEGTDTIPVFNSTQNFLVEPKKGYAQLSAEEVLTQRAKADPLWNREIPQGSLVAVHSTVSQYTSNKGNKAKYLSFNLLAVQIIALPNDC